MYPNHAAPPPYPRKEAPVAAGGVAGRGHRRVYGMHGRGAPGLAASSVVERCVAFLADAAARHDCTVPVYCFMPDHLHVMLWGQSAAADPWRAMVCFKQKSGFWFSQHDQPFRWQKDFYDHVLRPHEDWRRHVRYIAENPVRAGLVDRWDRYPFSGAIGYALDEIIQQM